MDHFFDEARIDIRQERIDDGDRFGSMALVPEVCIHLLHEYTERMYMPAAGVEVKRPGGRRTTEAG